MPVGELMWPQGYKERIGEWMIRLLDISYIMDWRIYIDMGCFSCYATIMTFIVRGADFYLFNTLNAFLQMLAQKGETDKQHLSSKAWAWDRAVSILTTYPIYGLNPVTYSHMTPILYMLGFLAIRVLLFVRSNKLCAVEYGSMYKWFSVGFLFFVIYIYLISGSQPKSMSRYHCWSFEY